MKQLFTPPEVQLITFLPNDCIVTSSEESDPNGDEGWSNEH